MPYPYSADERAINRALVEKKLKKKRNERIKA